MVLDSRLRRSDDRVDLLRDLQSLEYNRRWGILHRKTKLPAIMGMFRKG
jgi:hypothetical protein